MHLITEDPAKGKDLTLIRKNPSPIKLKEKKSSPSTALKNKIIDKVSDVMSYPARKYHESKSRGYQKKYEFAKQYQKDAKSGSLTPKSRAIMKALKE